MKYYFYFFITAYFLLNTATCNAMNERQVPQSKIITEITGIQNPRQAIFLNNNDIVLHGTNGCKIINRKTHDEITISLIENISFAVHPQRKKLALIRDSGITLYNTETRAEESTISCDRMPLVRSIFTPLDETIFAWSDFHDTLLRYNYQTKCCDFPLLQRPLLQVDGIFKTIACHPTQRRFITGMSNEARIYNYEQDGNFMVEARLPIKANVCEYSSDGSFIAGIDEHNIYIVQSVSSDEKIDEHNTCTVRSILPVDTKYVIKSLFYQDKAEYWYMKIHPNGSVLVTLSEPNDIICYWDVKKKELIDVTQSISSYYRDQYSLNPYLSFSPNGKMLAITFNQKCIVIPVPFEAMYHSITLKKALFIYWLLKHDKDNQYKIFPDEIRQLCMDTLLETCKR
jgi:WD40 repeat protein